MLVPPELELVPLELVLGPPELELVPPELVLGPPELELVPLEPGLAPLELVLVPPLELALVLPELELVPPVLAPLDPAPPVPVPELPFAAPVFDEVSLEPPEQPPAAATAIIAAPARNAGRAMETTERETRVLAFAKFMRELYYVHAGGHASTNDCAEPCSRTVNLHRRRIRLPAKGQPRSRGLASFATPTGIGS